jgi:hypothetical protein
MPGKHPLMLSHVVIFWTDPKNPKAADELISGIQTLKSVPGVQSLHTGKMVPSNRPVVDNTFQVALNLAFASKQAEQEYQAHPTHLEFVEKYVRRLVQKVVVYDFE